jgi:hypothetical protein
MKTTRPSVMVPIWSARLRACWSAVGPFDTDACAAPWLVRCEMAGTPTKERKGENGNAAFSPLSLVLYAIVP